MGKTSRALLFILINILVSAGTILLVLWLWERAHPQPEIPALQPTLETANLPTQAGSFSEQQPVEEPVLEFNNEDILINIRTIVGAGDLEIEYVEIINQGQHPADLTDWQLMDEDGHTFTFPALILNSGGAIKVLSRTGTNTVIELYWQSDTPIWQPGETARLLNASGELMASYSIP